MKSAHSRLYSSVISLFTFFQLIASQSCQTAFAPYPPCAIQYLCGAVPAQCLKLDGASATDECLCANTNFLTDSALGIYVNCGCDMLTKSAVLRVSICNEYAPDVPVTVEQYIAAGDGGQSSCQSSSNSATSTIAPPSPSTASVIFNSIPSFTTFTTSAASQPIPSRSTSQLTPFSSSSSCSSSSSSSITTTPSVLPSTITSSISPDHRGGTGLSAGAMAGIAIGGLVAAVISALVALDKWFQKKRHRRLFQVLCGARRPVGDGIEK